MDRHYLSNKLLKPSTHKEEKLSFEFFIHFWADEIIHPLHPEMWVIWQKNPSTWHWKWSPHLLVEVPSNSLRNTNLFCVWFTWSECRAGILGQLTGRSVVTEDWQIAFADWESCLSACPADVQEWCLQRTGKAKYCSIWCCMYNTSGCTCPPHPPLLT